MRPLDGIVILDLTRFLPGAVATMSLASFGAEVIKIEQPGAGDPARDIEGGRCLFAETNQGKKSVAIDLKEQRGKELFLRLAARADIVVESFRPGVMSRLGIDYSQLREVNPRLIFASLTGYGPDGADAQMAGHDLNYIAMSGLLELITSPDCAPTLPDIQIADLAGGSAQLMIGILLALQARERTGRGQKVDVSMVSGMRNLLSIPLAKLRGEERETDRGNELLSGAYACYSLYRAGDGRWLAVGALEEEFWSNLCHELGRDDLIDDQFALEPRQSEIKLELALLFSTRSADEWFDSLRSCDCCVTPVRSLREAVSDGYFERGKPPVSLSETPAEYPCGCTSQVGEHSEEVLQRFGVSQEELCVLKRAGVIQSGSRQAVVDSQSVAQE